MHTGTRRLNAGFARRGIRIAGVHQDRAGFVSCLFKMLLGDDQRSGDERVLCENRGSGCRFLRIDQCQVQRPAGLDTRRNRCRLKSSNKHGPFIISEFGGSHEKSDCSGGL